MAAKKPKEDETSSSSDEEEISSPLHSNVTETQAEENSDDPPRFLTVPGMLANDFTPIAPIRSPVECSEPSIDHYPIVGVASYGPNYVSQMQRIFPDDPIGVLILCLILYLLARQN